MSALKDEDAPKTIRMKREDLEAWLTALRSGKYTQGKGYLHGLARNTYCCLGVLQCAVDGDVEAKELRDGELPSLHWLESHGIQFRGKYEDDSVADPFLPALGAVASAANDALYPFGGGGAHKYDFNAIADAIEAAAETYWRR